MLDNIITYRVTLISYSQPELSTISASLQHLKSIVNNQPDFREPFLGGSYKRGTLVKGISDVDIYFRYIGIGNPQTALAKLKECLCNSYPGTPIKQDKPSIHADFNRIPFNITPYKEGTLGSLSIPDNQLVNWRSIGFGSLEESIRALRQKNAGYIDLIKILKLWNFHNKKGLKNFEIEKRVCNLFLNPVSASATQGISDWIWTFLSNNNFQSDANKFFALMKNNWSEATLEAQWMKFVYNKQ